ncbi:hypothetical protein P4H65_02640 [Paenibacillus chitinolyticus]|uniref:hypothetical protein n=1 Tax=Paenibacillus chitinolyticus TaxID=79263 RepID=UPI002DB95298|nr:hypothetical protein [Paenibacillus chitinolyticus]MEC0244716.1 hypothetical protein [Paenibacillus chitinolyticus]
MDKRLQKQLEAYEDDLISKEYLRKAKERVDGERQRLQEKLSRLEEGNWSTHKKTRPGERQKLQNDVNSLDRLKAKAAIRQLISKIEITNGQDIEIARSGE